VAVLEKIMENIEVQEQTGIVIPGTISTDLTFAFDIDLLAEDED
jgi:hypothetical protein